MAARELALIVDVDTGRLITSFNSTLQAPAPRFVLGDTVPIKFRAVRANPSLVPYPWQEVDITGMTPRIAIGSPAGPPKGGSFFVYYNGTPSPEIDYNATAEQVETAMNANTAISAAGGVSVVKVLDGSYRVTFNTVGAKLALSADVAGVYPLMDVTSLIALEGSPTSRQVVIFRMESQPAAYAELEDELPVASAALAVLRSGVDGVTEVIAVGATFAESVLNASALGTGDSFTLGTVTFTISASPVSETQILFSETAETFSANIVAKIAAHSTVLVNADAGPLDAIPLIAKTAGLEGNSIVTSSLIADFPAGFMEGGADAVEAVEPVTPVSKIVTLEFNPEPYGGAYTLAVDGVGTPAIDFDAQPSEIADAIGLIEGFQAEGVSVTGAFPRYTIDFGPANGAVGAVTCNVSGLVVPKGRAGILSTNTAGVIDLLNGQPSISAKLEIELYETATSTPWTIIQTEALVIDDVIPNSPSAQAGGPEWASKDWVETLYAGTPMELDHVPAVVQAERASASFEAETGNFLADETFTVGLVVYVAVASSPGINEFLIGASIDNTLTNLAAAINGEDGINDPHPDAYAGVSSGPSISVWSSVLGSSGNSIAVATTTAAIERIYDDSSGHLSGGTDATGDVPETLGKIAIVTIDDVRRYSFRATCLEPITWEAATPGLFYDPGPLTGDPRWFILKLVGGELIPEDI